MAGVMYRGAKTLIVDAATKLASHGHKVHIFTAHDDRTRCFGETLAGCILLPLSGFVAGSTHNHSSADISETHRLYRRRNDWYLSGSWLCDYPFIWLICCRFNFLSVNRFERKKNVELAICAFSLLQTLGGDVQGLNVADATLTVVGKSIYFQLEFRRGFDKRLRENVEYLEELESLADQKGVSHKVKFMTSCSTAERNMLLSQCLCVLYRPKDEHFGIIPLEAMAAYKPVIACNSGGHVETIKNGVTGFLLWS
ncbi:hypothetical protein RHSIM_Rhsim06G0208700 [Rhododendron simsii]|uniref:Alpha-1,3/1,6-mannosyltransferase ALG2 n=1 Tax=Rhododendron simsii TaxID=118357 RepID=A0A834GXE9_RHOSS|nr:hypothetical protein RHSIM_Rhsim06G0208700 [Rhododendron simsii]